MVPPPPRSISSGGQSVPSAREDLDQSSAAPMSPSMATIIEPQDVLQFTEGVGLRGRLHQWLHEERLNRTTLSNNLENQPIALTMNDETVYRFPYEHQRTSRSRD